MKKFIEEFKAFALRGNMMDMAVGVIIGGGFTGIVTSLTDNFINPILNLVTRAEMYTLRDLVRFASRFASDLLNFLILAFVLFCLIKGINKIMALGQKKQEPAAPSTKKCPYCLSDIPVQATRCPHCTSVLPEKTESAETV
ncbi:MAG TPA: large conductance mechanosensitive channel protein MscL [Candidatus Mediterraneibacter caccavium]|uniref:Large conductance mechanosensitive channel protein MscL n=1 Tax=Candidatus Mediterraneibacter caccavium TaxID=2838661 RepID=A0A9D2ARE9_9FIRM|nr:large conductance mechanosensitive channel protein MscL [Lachnoclostridium sp. An76]OUN33444.1 mechanosensitive ion channel protein MscL [Lachnoclostridium sp. An76]HIX47542.1 large conductance mechanosensitive channel protein MscL [Candidatus Mediterraneibacter caccavium]